MTHEIQSKEELLKLLSEAKRGDFEAWRKIKEAYEKKLTPFITYLVRKNYAPFLKTTDITEIIQDILQEVWELLILRLQKDPQEGGYDPEKISRPESFLAWLKEYFVKPKVIEFKKKIENETLQEISCDERKWPSLFDIEQHTPEDILLLAQKAREELIASWWLLRIVFLCGGYPHQQLSFGFSKLIYGRPSPRGLEGNPKKVDGQHGSTPLHVLSEEFSRDYASASQLREEDIEKCLEPLMQRLPLKLKEIMAKDKTSLKYYENMADSMVASTCLRDYYVNFRDGYKDAIPDWSDKLEKRVLKVLGVARGKASTSGRKETPCSRCKLRHLPPCRGSHGQSVAIS
ncbi:hypothetical protein [Candidatus Solincola tengchongensis]|uniref:hypothetical protein n=1 Tax=Candidatus Solincola tengchongensis TaxID=2900693 RepID=UPI00257C2B4B|nr:hypothetical protein [Candidatus Solincola tengchongensis]